MVHGSKYMRNCYRREKAGGLLLPGLSYRRFLRLRTEFPLRIQSDAARTAMTRKRMNH